MVENQEVQKIMVTVRELKRGDFFTKKPIPEPKENQVWIRDYYDQSLKKYCCYNFADVNHTCFLQGKKEIFTRFTF